MPDFPTNTYFYMRIVAPALPLENYDETIVVCQECIAYYESDEIDLSMSKIWIVYSKNNFITDDFTEFNVSINY